MDLLVNIDVPDLDAAVRFYTTAIGLRVGRTFGAFGVELLGAGAPVYLLVKDEGTAAAGPMDQRRTYERHWTPVHLDFVVEDMGRAVERPWRRARGWRSPSAPTSGASSPFWAIPSVMAYAL